MTSSQTALPGVPLPGLTPAPASTDAPTDDSQELLAGLNGPQREAVTHSGSPLLIVAGASIFSWLVAFERLPRTIVSILVGLTANKHLIMILLVLFLLFVGMFIETLSATIIVASPISMRLLPVRRDREMS